MRSFALTILAFVAAVVLTLNAASAGTSPVVYEGFEDYAVTTSINGLNGGTGWGGAWDGDNNVTSPGMSAGLGGGLKKLTTDALWIASHRNLPSTVDTGTAWISIFQRSHDASTSSRAGYLRLYNGSDVPLNIGANWESANWGVWSATASDDSAVAIGTAEAWLLTRIDYNVAGEDIAYMWVNPSTTSQPSVGDADATVSTADSGAEPSFAFNRVRLSSGATAAKIWDFDEIAMGPTWASVVPEPSTFALLGAGLLALLFAARRRKM